MTASVDITTDKRRLISYFFAPIVDAVFSALGERWYPLCHYLRGICRIYLIACFIKYEIPSQLRIKSNETMIGDIDYWFSVIQIGFTVARPTRPRIWMFLIIVFLLKFVPPHHCSDTLYILKFLRPAIGKALKFVMRFMTCLRLARARYQSRCAKTPAPTPQLHVFAKHAVAARREK